VIGYSRNDILRPGLDVSERAAFNHYDEYGAAESAVEIGVVRERAQELCKLHENVFAGQRTNFIFDVSELVRADICERAHAAKRIGI